MTDTTFEWFARQQVNNAGYFELSRLLRDHAVEPKAPASIVMVGSIYGVVASDLDASGASGGYLTAGGPGYAGSQDKCGPTLRGGAST